MRAATGAAIVLAAAGAAMTVAAFATSGGREPASPPAQRAAAARDGRAVWVANGCGSCHTFAPAGATGRIGPDLAASLPGKGERFIRESIVDPNAVAEPEWSTGIMPDDFAQRIPRAELDRLVAFIAHAVE